MDVLNQVSVSLKPQPEHCDDDEVSYLGALEHVEADILFRRMNIGTISAVIVDRQRIPEYCFNETFD